MGCADATTTGAAPGILSRWPTAMRWRFLSRFSRVSADIDTSKRRAMIDRVSPRRTV
jgi:hypothetical protein